MKRILACLATVVLAASAPQVQARQNDPSADALGALIDRLLPSSPSPDSAPDVKADWSLKASLYHSGAPGVGTRDSLGCATVPMRTAATDPSVIRRRTILFIPETVGMKMPDGSVHDGYWYASDTGGGIKGQRIDLYTGSNRASMGPIMKINMKTVAVVDAGTFTGCPRAGTRVASR